MKKLIYKATAEYFTYQSLYLQAKEKDIPLEQFMHDCKAKEIEQLANDVDQTDKGEAVFALFEVNTDNLTRHNTLREAIFTAIGTEHYEEVEIEFEEDIILVSHFNKMYLIILTLDTEEKEMYKITEQRLPINL